MTGSAPRQVSQINLVDLAGSERQTTRQHSAAEATRFKCAPALPPPFFFLSLSLALSLTRRRGDPLQVRPRPPFFFLSLSERQRQK